MSAVLVIHPETNRVLAGLREASPHAVLLTGPKGSGKTLHAHALALMLLNVSESDNLPGLKVLRVEQDKTNISIEQIRQLIKFFQLKVPGGARIQRVAIIEDADTMGTEAQNALLKLLEEPPEASVLVLTSSDPQALLATIRSRLQTVYLPAPDSDQLKQHFKAQGHDAAIVQNVLLRSSGNVAEAQRLLENAEEDQSMTLVKQALGGTAYSRVLLVDGLSKQKEAANAFVETLAIVATAGMEGAAKRNPAAIERWKSILQSAHTAQEALYQSGNTKLVLTELMLAL